MKRLLMTLGVFGLMLGAVPVTKAADLITAKVPFEFKIAGKTLPAGEYSITCTHRAGMFVLRSLEQDARVHFAAVPLHDSNKTGQPKLVFHTNGVQYQLGEVWMDGSVSGSRIPNSKEQLALVARTMPKLVVLAAHK